MDTQRQQQRQDFLIELYRQTDGDRFNRSVRYVDIGQALGFDDELANRLARELVDDGLAEFPTMGGFVVVTPGGRRHVEDLN